MWFYWYQETLGLPFSISKRWRSEEGCREPNDFKVLFQKSRVMGGTASSLNHWDRARASTHSAQGGLLPALSLHQPRRQGWHVRDNDAGATLGEADGS